MKKNKNNTPLPDEKMHAGHRSRMRSKFLLHGPRFFDTYELLEMLLYYAIPYKDTNPIAKRLLLEFGSLDGVLLSPQEEMAAVAGMGTHTAELIAAVDRISDAFFLNDGNGEEVFNDYDKAGKYLAKYLSGFGDRRVALLLLDNAMRKIELITLYSDVEYGSAAVKPKAFIDAAILSGASVVMTAHNHLYGPLLPSEADLQTNKLITQTLSSLGIMVAEHYLTVGEDYYGTEMHVGTFIRANMELRQFKKSKERSLAKRGREGELK